MKGSKISILTDKDGLPLAVALFPANMHDSKTYKLTIEGFKIKRRAGRKTIQRIMGEISQDTCNRAIICSSIREQEIPAMAGWTDNGDKAWYNEERLYRGIGTQPAKIYGEL